MDIWINDKYNPLSTKPQPRDSTKPTAPLKRTSIEYFKPGDFPLGWDDLMAQNYLIINDMSRMLS